MHFFVSPLYGPITGGGLIREGGGRAHKRKFTVFDCVLYIKLDNVSGNIREKKREFGKYPVIWS